MPERQKLKKKKKRKKKKRKECSHGKALTTQYDPLLAYRTDSALVSTEGEQASFHYGPPRRQRFRMLTTRDRRP